MAETSKALRECVSLNELTPFMITSDNGTEFVGKDFKDALIDLGIRHHRIHAGEPEENAKIERWWGTLENSIIDDGDLQLVVTEYNITWKHRELYRLTGIQMTPADAWRSMPHYEGRLIIELETEYET
jgi:transposase InsO family protein